MTSFSDEELISYLQSGDDKAFDILYTRYRNRLVTFGQARIKDKELAKELCQDIMTDLWQRRRNLNIHTNFAAFIFTAMRYAILDHIRKSAVKEKYISEMLAVVDQHSLNSTPSLPESEMLYKKVITAVDALPDKCRAAFKLSYFENKSLKEISEEMGISVNTAKYHIAHARKVLRSEIKYLAILWVLMNVN